MRVQEPSAHQAIDRLAAELTATIATAQRENPSGLRALALVIRQGCLFIVAAIERTYHLDSPRYTRRQRD